MHLKISLLFIAALAITDSYAQNTFPDSGNVGIGTLNPLSTLDIKGNLLISNADIPMGINTEVLGTTPLLNMSMNFREPNKNLNYLGAAFRIDTRVDAAPLFQWLYRAPGSNDEKFMMVLNANGDLGIGITAPTEKLAVNGKIRAKEVRVEADNWPDYVFHQLYKARTLPEIEVFIKKYNHLPEIPTTAEVSKNGVELGEMNAKLLKKIEELTLILIEQNKRIEKLEADKGL